MYNTDLSSCTGPPDLAIRASHTCVHISVAISPCAAALFSVIQFASG